MRLALILALASSTIQAQEPNPPIDLYAHAVAMKDGAQPPATPEYAMVDAAMQSYVNCAANPNCAVALTQFTTRLCALNGNREALANILYDIARMRQTAKAIHLLATIQAAYPRLQFTYTDSGARADLLHVLTEGLHLKRSSAAPWDENPGYENFPWNIPAWTGENLRALTDATTVARAAVQPCPAAR